MHSLKSVFSCVLDFFLSASSLQLYPLLLSFLNLSAFVCHHSLPQSGAMTTAIITALDKSGIVVLRTVIWWAAPVWAMAKESSNANHVSTQSFNSVNLKLLYTPALLLWKLFFVDLYYSALFSRWVHLLWWWKNVPSWEPVAEGIYGCHLYLYLLWRTTGEMRL